MKYIVIAWFCYPTYIVWLPAKLCLRVSPLVMTFLVSPSDEGALRQITSTLT
jgi:hypothetical protein